MDQKAEKIAQLLTTSRYVTVLTGHNFVAPAGIPNYRQAQVGSCSGGCHDHNHDCGDSCQGNCHNPEEFTLERLANKPENIYKIYLALLQAISRSQPTMGHRILLSMEQMKIIHRLITENVDDLHQIAGTQAVLELNGNTRGATCRKCFQPTSISELMKKIKAQEMPPKCSHCGEVLKPNIVFDDENNPRDFDVALEEIKKTDLLLVLGSDLELPRARHLANLASRLVIVNSQPTPFDSRAEISLIGDIQENLSLIWEKTQEELGLL